LKDLNTHSVWNLLEYKHKKNSNTFKHSIFVKTHSSKHTSFTCSLVNASSLLQEIGCSRVGGGEWVGSIWLNRHNVHVYSLTSYYEYQFLKMIYILWYCSSMATIKCAAVKKSIQCVQCNTLYFINLLALVCYFHISTMLKVEVHIIHSILFVWHNQFTGV